MSSTRIGVNENPSSALNAANRLAAQTAPLVAKAAAMTPAQRAAIGDMGALVPGAKIPGGIQQPYPGWPHDGSPQDQANTQALTKGIEGFNLQQYNITHQPTLLDKIALGLSVGAATAGIGSGLGLTAAGLGGGTATTASTIGAGAANGALAGAINSALSGGKVLQKIGIGGALGGVGGALGSVSSPATSALTKVGINPTVAAGLVRGTIGAGTGALGGAITGGKPGAGALVGGIGGAASGALGQATGSPVIGNLGGTIAAGLTSRAIAPTVSKPPIMSAAPAAVKPASSIPALPTTPSALTNIGSYSGYGYAPRTQVANPVTDYSHYGQGPEAQFFKTTGVAPAQPPVTATAVPTAPNFATAHVMNNIQSTGINKQNSV